MVYGLILCSRRRTCTHADSAQICLIINSMHSIELNTFVELIIAVPGNCHLCLSLTFFPAPPLSISNFHTFLTSLSHIHYRDFTDTDLQTSDFRAVRVRASRSGTPGHSARRGWAIVEGPRDEQRPLWGEASSRSTGRSQTVNYPPPCVHQPLGGVITIPTLRSWDCIKSI